MSRQPAMSAEQVLSWLQELKDSWLPENIPNDSRLLNLLDNKLSELERLLTGNTQDESSLAAVDKYPSEHSSDIEEIVVPTHQASEGSLPTPPHVHSHGNENEEKLHRPIIRIKRIPLAEAALFLPDDWEPPSVKSKRGRKKKGRKSPWTPSPRANGARKGVRRGKVPLPPALTESLTDTSINVRKSTRTKKPARFASPSDATSIPSTNGEKKKGRRKLRAMAGEDDDLYTLGNLSQDDQTNGDMNCEQIPRFIGQNGLLSQTRRVNETTTMCAFDEDYMPRPTCDPSPADDALSSEPTGIDTHQIMPDTGIAEPMNFLAGADCEQMFRDMVEAADTDSLFTSLELTRDKPFETSSTLHNNNSINYNDGIEDISNDGIDPPPSSSSPALSHFQLTT